MVSKSIMLRVLSAKPHLLLLETPMAIGNQRTGRLMGGGLPRKPKLLDQVRDTVRRKHYSIRTEAAYVDWIKRYIFFHQKRHPVEMGAREMEQFLNHLAVEKKVAASTQNQALSALVFLYREVLKQEFEWMNNLERAKKPVRLPVVLTESEVRNVLAHLDGRNWLMASLLYGAGLRLMECVRLRVKD